MTKIDPKDRTEQEILKAAIDVFNTQKPAIQDHLLERTSVVVAETTKKIKDTFILPEEIAKVINVFNFEYNLPEQLTANYFLYEINRLKEVNFDLPDIYSFLIRFALEEGFWIKYLTIDFPLKMRQKISKLITLDRALFGDLAGSKEDSALYIMERTFLINEIIIPMIYAWIKDHHRSSFYDAASSIICSMRHKAMEKSDIILEELCNRLCANVDSITGIISELDANGWANKAISEFKKLQEMLENCKSNFLRIDIRVAAELILENRLVLEYESLDPTNTIIPKKRPSTQAEIKEEYNVGFEKKETDLIKDKLDLILLKLEEVSEEQILPIIVDMVKESFDEGIKAQHQKPSIFAKDFLNIILEKLSINPTIAEKQAKKFENQLMYRLSTVGSKDYPNMSVDDKVIAFLQETINTIFKNRSVMQTKEAKITKQRSKHSEIKEDLSKEITVTEKVLLANQLRENTDKEIWLLIRDAYLKDLFDNTDELKAGSKVLRKMSLELGLLLTETEATSLIIKELDKLGLTVDGSNKEELDKNICKIIFAEIKEQKSHQTKIQ
ncbi:MAG: hypothetical protein JXA54_09905 [Candidatus Heimdallarchaeota archaeon]|nr:hypothetical protein [Candidatus Heimdallarchaeota archaeon]